MKKNNTRMLVNVALLIALNVVFARLISISTWSFRISFTFVTVFLTAYLYGPVVSVTVAALGDLIGALLFPVGAFNPAFTITAALTGLVYGIFLYNNNNFMKAMLAVILNQLVVSMLVNTYFISAIYNISFIKLLATRGPQSFVMLVVEFITIRLMERFLPKLKELADGK